MANVGPIAAEIGSGVLGHRSKFQRVSRLAFITAATSLTGGQPNFARCLAVSCSGTLCIHFRGLLLPDGILPRAKFTLRPSLAFSYIGSVTARHSSIGHQLCCGVVQGMELHNFRRGRHIYSARWPSRWALAHILVCLNMSRSSFTNLSLSRPNVI